MKRILLLALCIVAVTAVASLGGATSVTNDQSVVVNETPDGTAPTATAIPDATATGSTAVETTPTPSTAPTISTPTASSTSTPTTSPSTPPTRTPVPGTNMTAPTGGPDEFELVVDEHVAVVDSSWNDGTFTLRIYADIHTSITLLASPAADSERGAVQFKHRVLRADSTTVVRAQSPTGVSLWTDESAENQRVVYLRKPSQSIISGPYDGDDVRNAAIGAALGVAIAVLYEAVSAKIGASNAFTRQV